MGSKEKIIIMTKMAVNDKNFGLRDKKATEYFRHDYIYKKNFRSRLLSLIGCFIIFLFYIFDKIFVAGEDLFSLDYKTEGIKAIFFTIAVLAIYTVISSFIGNKEYNESQKRIKNQLALMKRLDSLELEDDYSLNDRFKEDTTGIYGTDAGNKRNLN